MAEAIARWQVAGKRVRCGHCSGETFTMRKTMLVNAGTVFLFIFGKAAAGLVCETCRHVEWFMDRPVREGAVGDS